MIGPEFLIMFLLILSGSGCNKMDISHGCISTAEWDPTRLFYCKCTRRCANTVCLRIPSCVINYLKSNICGQSEDGPTDCRTHCKGYLRLHKKEEGRVATTFCKATDSPLSRKQKHHRSGKFVPWYTLSSSFTFIPHPTIFWLVFNIKCD